MIILFLEKDVGILEMDKTAAMMNTLLLQIICDRWAGLNYIFDKFRDEHMNIRKKNSALTWTGSFWTQNAKVQNSCPDRHILCDLIGAVPTFFEGTELGILR